MAEWLSTIREVLLSVVCGESGSDNTNSLPAGRKENELQEICNGAAVKITLPMDDSSDCTSFSSEEPDTPTSVTESSRKPSHKVSYKTLPDLPVRNKSAQGAMFDNQLYIGGGYVSASKLSSILFKFDPIFELWESLPTCPVKMFGLATFCHQLTLVGGKETGSLNTRPSNKLFVWDKDACNWTSTLPTMTFARVSPVVISYEEFLIVAGGKKGSLDYNMEIYSNSTNKWTSAPPLPVKCLPSTSVVIGDTWYLLDLDNGSIKHSQLPALVQHASSRERTEDTPEDTLWHSLPSPPETPSQITAINGKLLAIVHTIVPVGVHCYIHANDSWSGINKLPNTCGFSSTVSDGNGGLFIFGGEGGAEQYSNKLYKLSLRTVMTRQLEKPSLTFSL